jgi:hypothetical protein
MNRLSIDIDIPASQIGLSARAAALAAIEILGLKAQDPIIHPDFIDGATVEIVLASVIAIVARKRFEEGADEGVKAVMKAFGYDVTAQSRGTYGNATG